MVRYPHKIKGQFKCGSGCSGIESQDVVIDNSGNIIIGNEVIFSTGVIIYTHDHYMKKGCSVVEQTKNNGVKTSALCIGNDVYFGARSMVLEKVTNIPNGTIIAAGAVLTKNPVNENEIWGGVPAKKIGDRK